MGDIMRRHLVPALALLAAGCASGPPLIDRMQPVATAKAERRAQFDLDCPGATGQVLNREEIQPLLFGGPQRAQYTIGVAGCGRRATVVVLCSDNNDQCVEGESKR
jgi:hypothetical protein